MLLYPSSTLRGDPFLALRRLQDEFDRAFAPFVSERGAAAFPAVNMWQGENSVAVTAELPGVEAEDLEISVKEDTLTLTGERKMPEVGEKAMWHMRERPFGRFARTVRLPFRVDAEKVEARFTDGVLQIEVQQHQDDRPRRIPVKVS